MQEFKKGLREPPEVDAPAKNPTPPAEAKRETWLETLRSGDTTREYGRFDLGIADLLLLGPADQEVYLVEFRCRCAVIVARGQVIRRTRGFKVVCEHVSGDG